MHSMSMSIHCTSLEYGVHCQSIAGIPYQNNLTDLSLILWFGRGPINDFLFLFLVVFLGLSSLLHFATGEFDLFLFNPSVMAVVLRSTRSATHTSWRSPSV